MLSALKEAFNTNRFYEPLPPTYIRLIYVDEIKYGVVRCSMISVDLNAKPHYVALSYTWGDPRQECYQRPGSKPRTHGIFVNGCPRRVTENLWSFLRKWASGCPATQAAIWIDALCINQDDKEEKAVQVQRMDKVYKGASKVIVWLGDRDWYTKRGVVALRLLAEINSRIQSEAQYVLARQRHHTRQDVIDWEALISIFSRAWFRRVWVIQEAALAQDIVTLYGDEVIGQDVLKNAVVYVTKTGAWNTNIKLVRKFSSSQAQAEKAVPSMGTILGALAGSSQQSKTPGFGGEQAKWVALLGRGLGATDTRDHAYALVGLLKDSLAASEKFKTLEPPEVNYNDEIGAKEVFPRFAAFMFNNDAWDYVLLASVEDRRYRHVPDLPSFVPDLSCTLIPGPFLRLGINTKGVPGEPWCPSGEGVAGGGIYLTNEANIIKTKAAKFDIIHSVALEFQSVEVSQEWAQLIDFIKPIALDRQSYDRPIEALARTMIVKADPQLEEAPSPAMNLVKWTFAKLLLGVQKNALSRAVTVMAPMAYSILTGNKDPNRERSLQLVLDPIRQLGESPEIDEIVRELSSGEYNSDVRSKEIGHGLDSSVEAFEFRCKQARGGRRLFRTSQNYLGLAALSTAPGDEVWIMPESPSAFVLRPVGNGTYELVGEAYVHGIMHGEVADRLHWEEIRIS